MTSEKQAGEWDFSGQCAPGNIGASPRYESFSLGCFQWVETSSGKGLKKGKVQYRIKGDPSNPEEAYEKARKFCEKKNQQRAKYNL